MGYRKSRSMKMMEIMVWREVELRCLDIGLINFSLVCVKVG